MIKIREKLGFSFFSEIFILKTETTLIKDNFKLVKFDLDAHFPRNMLKYLIFKYKNCTFKLIQNIP